MEPFRATERMKGQLGQIDAPGKLHGQSSPALGRHDLANERLRTIANFDDDDRALPSSR